MLPSATNDRTGIRPREIDLRQVGRISHPIESLRFVNLADAEISIAMVGPKSGCRDGLERGVAVREAISSGGEKALSAHCGPDAGGLVCLPDIQP